MPSISFSHPNLSTNLTVRTGVDDISWSYKLNTQTYPTYGGEVVQILSAYTDTITLGGTVRSYEKMEQIYSWFLDYLQSATQGGYSQEPVIMAYNERGWRWAIHPLSLPGFKYGREVVAPTWRLEAAVHEADEAIHSLNLQAALEEIEKVTLGIGFKPDNPFSDPFAAEGKDFDPKSLKEFYEESADYFSNLIPKYLEEDYESLLGGIGSKPAFLTKPEPRQEQEARRAAERAAERSR